MQVAGQNPLTYVWADDNRLQSIAQSGTLGSTSVAFTYDDAHRRESLTLPNGIVLSYAYDNASRIIGMSWMLGTNQVGDLEYSYDADGHVIEKTGTLASTGIPALVSGNTFNAANEMTAFNGTPMSYDLNGNLTGDGINTYSWDARNHLSTLTGSGTPATSASYVYDAIGRRASKNINNSLIYFLYDGLNPVQELTSAGGQFLPTANMFTGLGIDEFFQRNDVNGAQSYLSDALQSTLALTNSLGTVTTSYTYEPFGNVSVSPSQTNTNPYQFTGRENDGTGLYYYRARYYNPSFQRFVDQDPIGFAGRDADLYAYVFNSPVSLNDPLGLVVLICGRAAQLPFPLNQFDHQWIKTDKWEAGMGARAGEIPGQNGNSDWPYTPTQTIDHSGQSKEPGASCHQAPPHTNEQCVDKLITPGRRTGPWSPWNNCQSFVSYVISECSEY